MSGVLGCAKCKSNCCGFAKNKSTKKINIYRGELGSDLNNMDRIQEMPMVNNMCQFLKDGLCTVYNNTLKPFTCKLYPFTIDEFNNLFISSTCPDYPKIIDGLTKGEEEWLMFVNRHYQMALDTPLEMKKFWGEQIRNGRSVVVQVNPKIIKAKIYG